MYKISFDRIPIIVLALLSTILLLYLCFVLDYWIRALDQPTCADWAFFAYLEILFILLIISGWILVITWNNYLGYVKLVFIITYAALLSVIAATYFHIFSGVLDADWISGFFLSLCTGLITGLVIYFVTNKRRQNEREVEDEIKILEAIKDSYDNVCLFLYFEQMNRDSGVEYENPFEKYPNLVHRFMTNIKTLYNSNLLQIKKTKNPKKGEDSENQAVLNIITNFPNRVDYYIETYAKTKNSEEVKKLRDEFIKELIILEIFVDTKLDESQNALRRIKYSMF